MKFSELNLSDEILGALEKLGMDTPTAIQEAAIPVAMTGKDLIGKSVTGSGKTFAYGLPLIHMLDRESDAVQAVVVCPTRELAEQVAVELRKITNACDRIKVQLLTGGMDMSKQIKGLKDGAKIVVGTPGRICDHLRRRTLKTPEVKTVVLDEADEMLTMGFREELSAILAALPRIRRTWMFSATMPDGVRDIAEKFMQEPETVEIGGKNATVSAIRQGYIFCKNADKNQVLINALKAVDTDKCLVFCNTRKTVETLADALTAMHFNVRALHGQMQQSQRRRAMSAARSYDGAVLVATDVAARGIDISDIEYVFNYDLPHELEYYIHRIGRTARAGKQGTAVSVLCTRMQQNKLTEYANATKSTLVAMAVSDGKLTEIGAVKDEFEEKVRTARAEGDIAKVRELETEREEAPAATGKDRMMESMLTMLRRAPNFENEIAEMKTFGFTDEELLAAALGLYSDAKSALERSRDDRRRAAPYRGGVSGGKYGGKPRTDKPYGKKPYGEKSYGNKPYGEKSYGEKSYGKKSYGDNAYGEKSYGEKSYGKKSYGEKSYGSGAYKKSSDGRSKYGTKPTGKYPSRGGKRGK